MMMIVSKKKVLFCCQHTYAADTKKSYCNFLNSFQTFCICLGLPLLQASTGNLYIYLVYLAKFLLPQSAFFTLILLTRYMKNPSLLVDWFGSKFFAGN